VCKSCKEKRQWRLQVHRQSPGQPLLALPMLKMMQVEKAKCKLLDLEAQQSDDCETSEGSEGYGLQTQANPAIFIQDAWLTTESRAALLTSLLTPAAAMQKSQAPRASAKHLMMNAGVKGCCSRGGSGSSKWKAGLSVEAAARRGKGRGDPV